MRDTKPLSMRYMTGGIVIVFGGLLLAVTVSAAHLLPDAVVISFLLPALIGGFSVGFKGISYAHRHRDKMDAALATGELDGIGAIVDCLETNLKYSDSPLFYWQDMGRFNVMWQDATDTLIRLAPQITTENATLLSERQWRVLYSALKSHDGHLVLAILEIAERLGDRRALPVVQELVAGKWKAETDEGIKQAAENCLRVLQEQEEAERRGKTLLRASQAEQAAPPTLLRAATATATTNETELLRVGISHDQR